MLKKHKETLRDLIIYCDRPSNTVSLLAQRLACRRLVHKPNKRLRRTAGALVVNYGNSLTPAWLGDKSIVLNHSTAVVNAISKVKSHDLLRKAGVPTLEQTTVRGEASKWVQDGCGVLCRRDGLSGGKGIVFIPKGAGSCPVADFYTKYFPKTHEFRAHVVSGILIDLTQKRLKNGQAKTYEAAAERRIVRSLANGWIHAHEFQTSKALRKEIESVAVQAVAALGLDFGAVDLLYKDTPKEKKLVICEVNTAPGLGNEATLKAYVDAFRQLYDNTRDTRFVPMVPRRRKVRKMVLVTIKTKKGNFVKRERMRTCYESICDSE